MAFKETYTVFRTADLGDRDDLPDPLGDKVVIDYEAITDASHTPVGQLLALLDEEIGYSREQVERAIRWNNDLAESCRSVLETNRRFRTEYSVELENLEIDMAELRNRVLQVLRSGGGQTLELLRQLVDPAGEEHDCPNCECWMYKPGREVER